MVLTELFNQMWGKIRQANLCGGQPQSASSRESLSIARQALSVAAEAQDDHLLTEAWCMMAYALNVNDEWVEALSYYRLAVQALDQAADHKRAASVRLGFIHVLSMTGQSREALLVGREAFVLFSQQQDSASLAKLATNLGTVYQRLDDNERAVGFHSEAADLFRQIGDERSLAQVYLNLGNTFSFLDRFAEAEGMYESCERLSSPLELYELRDQARYNKAYLYFLSGRLSQALALFREVRTLFSNGGSHRFAALCDLDEAEIYVQLRLPHDALLLARAAADAFRTLGMQYEQGKAIAFAAVALTQKSQFGDALAAFREAQTLLEQDGNAFWSAQLKLYRAEVLFSIGRLCEAHALASDADGKFKELGCTAKRLVSLVLLGRVSMEMGKLDDAEFCARTVQDLAEQTKTSFFLFACHALLAEIAERLGRSDEAMDFYERAAREIESRHTHLHHDELGITFYKGKTEVFESVAHLTLESGAPGASGRAYTWCEKAKSQMFVDALAPHLPSVRRKANEELLSRVDRIRGELNSSYLRLRPEFSATPGLPKLGEDVELKEEDLVRTLNELSKSDSEYVSLQNASSVGLEELQYSLPAETTMIEYLIARGEVLAFVVTQSEFHVVRHLTTTKRLQYLFGRLQYQLKTFAVAVEHGRADDAASKPAADELMRQFYNALFEGLAPSIRTQSVVVVPHGLLSRVPFHAFHDGNGYLADRFDISYAPSGSVLKYCLDRDPVADTNHVVLRPDADRAQVIREAASAHVIQLEVPIALRQDNPVLSGLEMVDGAFCIPDIYSMHWNTNLLSLYPNRLSSDIASNGDDLLGLLRAFLYAGSRAVLFELWRIRREPSAIFFSTFYFDSMAGQSKQNEMRRVREVVRLKYPHPFDWAPFVLAGRP